MIIYVNSEGQADFRVPASGRPIVGPVFSIVDDRLIFTMGMSVAKIMARRERKYQQLQIAAGYGAGEGPGIALISDDYVVPEEMELVLLSYSCYPPALAKIRECMEASRRYDCWVQRSWIYSHFDRISEELREHGIRLFVTSIPEGDEDRAARNRIPWGPVDE